MFSINHLIIGVPNFDPYPLWPLPADDNGCSPHRGSTLHLPAAEFPDEKRPQLRSAELRQMTQGDPRISMVNLYIKAIHMGYQWLMMVNDG